MWATAPALAVAVVALLESPQRAERGERARQAVLARFGIDRLVRDVADLYTAMLTHCLVTLGASRSGANLCVRRASAIQRSMPARRSSNGLRTCGAVNEPTSKFSRSSGVANSKSWNTSCERPRERTPSSIAESDRALVGQAVNGH